MKNEQQTTGNILFTLCIVCGSLFLFSHAGTAPETIRVNSLSKLKEAVENAQPGTEIILADRLYRGETVLEARNGTASLPIIIRAENQDRALIGSTITLKGDHLELHGFGFQKRGSVVVEGNDCRVSRCTFSDSKATKWVRVLPGSSRIEIDHNLFENKTINLTEKSCQLMQIIVLNQHERHHIHHNLFRDIPQGDGNGYETLQLITKGNPFDPPPGDCGTIIEQNLFVRCNGEAEVISVKSNGNLIRDNTFRACRGSLVFRHGDNNTATRNYFFGDGEPGSGGVRIQGTDQTVANNFFHELGQFGIGMMDGTPDDLYVQVERARILFNTFFHCSPAMVVGLNHSKHPNGTTPKDCLIAGNIFYSGMQNPLFVLIQEDQPENWTWTDNVAYGDTGRVITEGLRKIDPKLDVREDGVAYPTEDTPFTDSGQFKTDLVSTDLLGQARGDSKTLGAIQYPVGNIPTGFLTEDRVGPKAE